MSKPEDLTSHIQLLAEISQIAIRPEHMGEVVRNWRLMAPHRARVIATLLGPDAEPAPVFRP